MRADRACLQHRDVPSDVSKDAPANFNISPMIQYLVLKSPKLPSSSLHPRASLTTRHRAFFIFHSHTTQRSNHISKPDVMRYQDWDILLYPKECEVPFKEFKTTCYAVQEGGGGGSTSGNGMSSSLGVLDGHANSNRLD
jgi:hypothetical protein